tara:strand:+ start:441 stop:551 length:111 start_codon:yes stop_codon:yes gene_type:complete
MEAEPIPVNSKNRVRQLGRGEAEEVDCLAKEETNLG